MFDRLSNGQVATVDADTDAVPGAWSKLPPGRYHLQAVLDVDGNYNYAGRGAGDVISKVVDVTLPGPVQAVALSSVMPADDPYAAHNPRQQALAAYFPKLLPIDFVSPKLTAFWGRPVHMRGWVALPPDYDAKSGKTWPTVYQTHGFGGDVHSARWTAASYLDLMTKGRIPPMIYVTLDESSPTGTHEFADSVNNGPWGAALTTELIPWLEQHYRMDAKPSGRFLTGHSSGGWATLWLQTRYPTVFGGTWSTSPDPSDFHDFTGADLYRANANVYVDASGKPVPLVRMKGRDVANFEDFARLEAVLGPIGGQMASFDWVFSPKGPDGRPMQMFDRRTGAVDPAVAAYWRNNYDIAYRLQRDWPSDRQGPRRQDPRHRRDRRHLPPRRSCAQAAGRSPGTRRQGRRAVSTRQDPHGPVRSQRRSAGANGRNREGDVCRGAPERRRRHCRGGRALESLQENGTGPRPLSKADKL